MMIFNFWEKKNMIRSLFLFSLLLHSTLAKNPGAVPHQPIPGKKWSTLSGNEPLVIARGGFSGLFPEGFPDAIDMAQDIGIILCNLQLSKDGSAYCVTGVTLDNATNIATVDPNLKVYNVNGKDVQGHFATDYDGAMIDQNVSLVQSILSRPNFFDGNYPVLNVDNLLSGKRPPRFWLNVQNAAFYTQYGIKAADTVIELLKAYPTIEFVSSPDIGFLRSIAGKTNKVKVVFRLLNPTDVEPTTKQPYSNIIKDLPTIKSFASGIMVPKGFIHPVKPDKYLEPPTAVVADAHKLGLEIYASGFANDLFTSYNYYYDPTAEYLQYLDSVDIVDGVVTDFPETAANAIACFAHNNTLPKKGPTLIISSNGASAVYPGNTDLAYQQAITDGADIIDCPVQMTKDGIAFCADSADLIQESTAMIPFMSRSSTVPELQPKSGIFSFDLTWAEIQTLKPQMILPLSNDLPRNPAEKNNGKFVTLPEFLELAKTKAVGGILIHIPNAPYLASKKGLDIVGAVTTALSNATFDKQTTQQVFIQSDDTSVLSKFKDIPSYKRVLYIQDKNIDDIPVETAEEIKKHAEGVNILRGSIIKIDDDSWLSVGISNIVKELKGANLTVFARTFRNEYLSLAFDYWADPNIEIATFIQTAKIDGIVTDFPATANRFLRSPCSNLNDPNAILATVPGELMQTAGINITAKPPTPLQVANVVDPPLPPVINPAKTETPAAPTPPSPSSGATAYGVNSVYSLLTVLVVAILYAGH